MRFPHAVVLALLLALSGCSHPKGSPAGSEVSATDTNGTSPLPSPSSSTPSVPPGIPPSDGPPVSACQGTDVEARGPVCIHWLDVEGGPDLEATLATHPADPDVVLVSWTRRSPGLESGAPEIVYAAVTRDAGATWVLTGLHDPNLVEVPTQPRLSYDSAAAFGPDGTAYVVFGGEASGNADPRNRLTLAVSEDLGATWTYRVVAETPAPVIWDGIHVTVAPDTGDVYVASANVGGAAGAWFWRSGDQGATWSVPLPLPGTVYGAPDDAAARNGYWPKLAAGPGGRVAVATSEYSYSMGQAGQGQAVSVSLDDGASFGPPRRMTTPEMSSPLIGIPLSAGTDAQGTTHLADLLGEAEAVWLRRSTDWGASWTEPSALLAAPEGQDTAWVVSDVGADGSLAALATFEGSDPPSWSGRLLVLSPQQELSVVSLGDLPGRVAYPVGDEYGGVAFAADGSLWATWADLGHGSEEAVAVAHLTRIPT